MRRLTGIAQDAVSAALQSGAVAVDATAGNGHDTVFLARCVGADGRVFAIDLQASAIDATRRRLDAANLLDRVTLINACHSALGEHLADAATGGIAAVMFNLGFLPGGDRSLISQPVTTIAAIDAALQHLRDAGIASIMSYRGHPGGNEETRSVADYIERLSGSDCDIERFDAPGDGPVLWLIRPRRRDRP